MGIEIAEELNSRGHEVLLIIGPTHLSSSQNIKRINVVSADDMYDACIGNFSICDIAIMSAAVADYKPSKVSDTKIKRNGDSLILELIPNRDIAKDLGKIKRSDQKLIGFALETNDGILNAIKKIESKNLDMIVLNQIGDPGVGFKFDTNKITLIKRDGSKTEFGMKPKSEVAKDIVDNL
jgi:phosphopantothenoylcysteine decarboxylase/phosphopantothenate--cysteine ligase